MGAKHPPGYDARRRRLERYAAAALKAAHPDEWAEAWAEGEQLERLRDASSRPGAASGGQETRCEFLHGR
jgi:hypothetical protein